MAAEPESGGIEEIAADWLVRCDRGLSAAEERELAIWRRADTRHDAAFEALAETWALIGEARSEPVRTGRNRRNGAWRPVVLAAAAMVAVATTVWWQSSRVTTRAGAGAVVRTETTEIGALRQVPLPDGSVIQLNTDSAVEVDFTRDERRVRLVRGEAQFTVAKDPDRPFTVGAAGVHVRAVGTVFNVRLRAESVDVLVTEGKVRVRPASEVPREPVAHSELSAGQKVSVILTATTAAASGAPVDVTAGEVRQTLAWQTRRLDFVSEPLAVIIAEVNRYNRHQLVIADSQLEARRFGGSFPATDPDTLVRMLEADFGVAAERQGGVTLLRQKAP